MAYPPAAGHQPVRSTRDRTERDVIDTQERVRNLVRQDYDQQTGQKFYIDNEVVLTCWSEIWRWLNVTSLSSHLLKYGVVSDPSELYSLNNPYHTPRQRADHLLELVYKGGLYGCHLLYMCIRDDDENPLGHASAVERLIAVARAKGKQPPHELFGRFQQHLVYRDGVGGREEEREEVEQDDEAGPQSFSIDTDGRRGGQGHRGTQRDRMGVIPPVQETGYAGMIVQRGIQNAEQETTQWPQQHLVGGGVGEREAGGGSNDGERDGERRQSGGEGRESERRGSGNRRLGSDDVERDGPQSRFRTSNSASNSSPSLVSRNSPSNTSESRSSTTRRQPDTIPLRPPSSFTSPLSTPPSSTSSTTPSPSANTSLPAPCATPMRRVASFPPSCSPPLPSTSHQSLQCAGIIRTVEEMLAEQSLHSIAQLTENGVDVQFCEVDEIETVDDLTTEILKYATASFNSRMQYHTAVFIAGVDMDVEEGVPHIVGLPLGQRELANMRGRVSNCVSSCVFSKAPQEEPQPESSSRVMPMIHVGELQVSPLPSPQSPSAANLSSPLPGDCHNLPFVIVTPDWSVCQNRLFFFVNRRKREVFQCLNGSYVTVKKLNVKQLLNDLDHAYSERDGISFCSSVRSSNSQ